MTLRGALDLIGVAFAVALAIAGIVTIGRAENLAREWADERNEHRYGMPMAMKPESRAGNYAAAGLMLPGTRVRLRISDQSTPFRYVAYPAEVEDPEPPEWMNGGGPMPLDQGSDPDWFEFHVESGNQKPTTGDAWCKFYLNGRFTHEGKCKARSNPAEIQFSIAEEPGLIGKALSMGVRTPDRDQFHVWRVSSPDQEQWWADRRGQKDRLLFAGAALIVVAGLAIWRIGRRYALARGKA